MRLFAAVNPPARVFTELAEVVGELRELPGADRLRWTQPSGWHLTLAFYGDVPDELRPELERRLSRAAARGGPFPLQLTGGGRFGDRTLWTGVAGERAQLVRLAGSAVAAGRRTGIDMGKERAYLPHLTLARSRNNAGNRGRRNRNPSLDRAVPDGAAKHAAVDLRPFAERLAPFESERWEAVELALVRSRLPDSGVPGEQPRYETVTAWSLGGADD